MRVQREDDEEDLGVPEMVEFLEALNEPLESEPLRDCIEDLRDLGMVTDGLHEEVEAVDTLVGELIEQIEKEINADKGDEA